MTGPNEFATGDVAIVGMAVDLPGAPTLDAFWEMLSETRTAIRRLTPQELAQAGVPEETSRRPDYVPFGAPLEGNDLFDAGFFGLTPKDAAIMDPQHRRFIRTAWAALENAGRLPEGFDGAIGVYAGCGPNDYYMRNLMGNAELRRDVGTFLLRHTGNDKDFLATRLSHMLDLTGPAVSVQTACSTSLVAVHMAAQALLTGECDMALAGGATIEQPQGRGYLYREGEILSPDGMCRAFDHRAAGTVFGSGAAVVALRRLEDALAAGDHIWAVIRGTSINNDGARKASYLAPSVEGQAAAVAAALRMAGVGAESLGFVECHGTGTALGDPIEVAALTRAFRETTQARGFCRIGSVKTGIGHTDTAAGAASLIKAALALHHGTIPGTPGFEAPNPAIALADSPFEVAATTQPWPRGAAPRRAGVNSLGVGGTNAHAVLEEAPARGAAAPSDWPFELIRISAPSRAGLDATAARLATHLRANPELALADVAATLAHGRRALSHRRVLLAETGAEAADLLDGRDPRRATTSQSQADPEVVFLFPGGGAQQPGMGRDLYETEPVFRDWIDHGFAAMGEEGAALRALWAPAPDREAEAAAELRRPSRQLPLLLIVEHALARLWIDWGVRPARLIGHSMGENTAAVVAGIMSFEEALGLVRLRGELFEETEPGAMLSVALPAEALRAELDDGLDIAAINAPALCVASGPVAGIEALAARLVARGAEARRIPIEVAAHSRLLDPVLPSFVEHLRGMRLSPPKIPVISNRTGRALTAAEATDPQYWAEHLRHTVDFDAALYGLEAGARIFVEIGPGTSLGSFAGQQPGIGPGRTLAGLRPASAPEGDDRHMIMALGRLWAMGGAFDEAQLWASDRRRVPLPGTTLDETRHFIEPAPAQPATLRPAQPARDDDMERWGWCPEWSRRYPGGAYEAGGDLAAQAAGAWLVFCDETGLGAGLVARLRAAGHAVACVSPGPREAQTGPADWTIRPEAGEAGCRWLFERLAEADMLPERVVHLWSVTAPRRRGRKGHLRRMQMLGYQSLMDMARGWHAAQGDRALRCLIVSSEAYAATPRDRPDPAKATLDGPAMVIPRELPGMALSRLDLCAPRRHGRAAQIEAVLEEALSPPAPAPVAWRDGVRRERGVQRVTLSSDAAPVLRHGGAVMITGGLGGIGLTLAETLIREAQAPVALVSRRGLPPRDAWEGLVAAGGEGEEPRLIRAVLRLEALGGRVMVLRADVTDLGQMQGAVAEATAALGPLSGVIHAAGRLDDAPVLGRDPAAAEAVLAPKLYGLKVLDALFPDGQLDWMALCASSSGWTTPAGQADYVAANAALDAYAQSRMGGTTRVVAIDWGIWADTGMTASGGKGAVEPWPPASGAHPDPAAMFDHRETGDGILLGARWSPATRWFLDQHRTRAGEALLPGTGYAGMMAELAGPQGFVPFELRELRFLAPLHAPDAGETRVRARLRPSARADAASGEGPVLGMVEVEAAPPGADWGPVATCRIDRVETTPYRIDIAAIATRLGPFEPLVLPQQAHLDFGAQWQVMGEARRGAREGLARLRLPPGAITALPLHPGLLDIATGWAIDLVEGYDPARFWVPAGYGLMRVHAPLPDRIVSHARLARQEDGVAWFDLTLCTPEGKVCVEIEGFEIRRLMAGLALQAARGVSGASPVRPDPLDEARRQGIHREEGGAAFLMALRTGLPQIAMTAQPLPELIAAARATRPAPAAPAPEVALSEGFETETQAWLAGQWMALLGVERVGPDDSFFDLGGHSLIAVRLFAAIRRETGTALPISVLFESPTIRALAARLESEGPEERAEASDSRQAAKDSVHLVALGTKGERTPLFISAGMFGNVMNLRHLAGHLGEDRPIWGLQARGLTGDVPPHRSFEAAARDCLTEMRRVHPGGPWLLAGYSGGGLIAFEMARQLAAEGEKVAQLMLLDTPLPQRPPLRWQDRLSIQAIELREAGLAYPWHWLRRRLRWEIGRRRHGRLAARPSASPIEAAIEAAFYEASAAYRPQRWDGPMTLFRPPVTGRWHLAGGRVVNEDRQYVLEDNGWRDRAPALEVIEVPGDHDSMVLDPNAQALAARIRAAIAAVETEVTTSRLHAAE